MRAISFLFIITALTPQVVRSEILEIPMPELQGWYSHPDSAGSRERNVVVDLTRHPALIRTAWIELTGDVSVGLVFCSPFVPSSPWLYNFGSICDDTISGGHWYFRFSLPHESGPFHVTSNLLAQNGATWDFVTGTSIGVLFYGGSMGLPAMCAGVIKPYAYIKDAVFGIDADFIVPVASETWGRIKALYSKD